MTAILVTWVANSLAIYAVAYLLSSVDVASASHAFLAGAVLTLINAFVKPILALLSIPYFLYLEKRQWTTSVSARQA